MEKAHLVLFNKEENRGKVQLEAGGSAHAGELLVKPVASTLTEGVVQVPGQSVHSHIPRQKSEQGLSELPLSFRSFFRQTIVDSWLLWSSRIGFVCACSGSRTNQVGYIILTAW